MTNSYQSDLPYPPVRAEAVNLKYADLMLGNMGGGSSSEMSAVNLYFYNSVILRGDEELSQTFHKISIVEMRHLNILGNLALQLGADPRLWARHRGKLAYWTPGYVKYHQNVKRLLEYALDEEQATIRRYTEQIKVIEDKGIISNLARIIVDEELHISIFQKLLAAY